ncbi:MAG: hypothetical protein SGI71_13230 [Verrucomicrobiota bacterium]|nr:hypothetical protein [Verrucomicrobiota bacterium]
MLRDRPIKSVPINLPRKWIFDEIFELIVWYKSDATIFGFQLIHREALVAITWRDDFGYKVSSVDPGEEKTGRERTPILEPSFFHAPLYWLDDFKAHATELPQDIYALVVDKLTILLK